MVTKFFFATKTEVRSSRFHYYLDNPLPMWNSFSVFFVDLSIRTKERKCPNENRINFSFWFTQKKIDIETKAQESNSVESSSSYLPSLLCRSFFFVGGWKTCLMLCFSRRNAVELLIFCACLQRAYCPF